MKEYLLTTNEFKEPASVSDQEAFAILLLRLFLLQPGTNPLHPEMGVGLVPKYRFITTDDLSTLRDRISDQIKTYFPESFAADVEVRLKIKPSKYLSIIVIANGESYVYDTEDSETPVQLSEVL